MKYRDQIISLLLVIVFALAVRFIWQKYLQDKQEITQKMSQVEFNAKTLEKLDSLGSQLNELQMRYTLNEEDFFRNVEIYAKDSGVVLESLTPQRQAGEFIIQPKVSLKLICPYQNLIDFIKRLEDDKMIVEDLIIQSQGDRKSVV